MLVLTVEGEAYFFFSSGVLLGVNMVEDKDMLLSCTEKPQFRLRNTTNKMVKLSVRVLYKELEYYGTLRITTDRIEIEPYDDEIDPLYFNESHLDGCTPLVNTEEVRYGLKLNFKSKNRPPIKIIVKNYKDLERAEKAISTLFSASTDCDSSEMEVESGSGESDSIQN